MLRRADVVAADVRRRRTPKSTLADSSPDAATEAFVETALTLADAQTARQPDDQDSGVRHGR